MKCAMHVDVSQDASRSLHHRCNPRHPTVICFRRPRRLQSSAGSRAARCSLPSGTLASMKLYWSSRSPFVRKVMVAAHEMGIGQAHPHRAGRGVGSRSPMRRSWRVNPLNKIPTLVLDDGTALYDSRVICEYLDTLHDGPKLFPADAGARWTALRRQALGDGLMEVIVLRLGEQNRPAANQSRSIWRRTVSRSRPRSTGWRARTLEGPIDHRPHRHRLRAGPPRLPLRRRRLARGPAQAGGLVSTSSRAGRPCRPPNTSTRTEGDRTRDQGSRSSRYPASTTGASATSS